LHQPSTIVALRMSIRQVENRLVGVDRVLAALRELADHPQGVALEELARRLGLPKSSVHRALAALRRFGLAQQDADRRYRLSLEFVGLAFRYYESLEAQSLVGPTLETLAKQLSETAHYAVLDGADVIYVARVAPPDVGFKMAATIGGRQPAHTTALGKVLLAHTLVTDGAVGRFVEDHGPLRKTTPRALTTVHALEREFAAIRHRGYALDDQENESGVNCIGFPVFLGPRDRPAGAMSVSAVAHRMPAERLAGKAEEIRALIEAGLGPVTRAGR
jgi:IclR family transcriptional regulator, acetate operon repressor